MQAASLTRQTRPGAGIAGTLPASAMENEISSGLVAVEGVSGLISDLFFENKAHKDAVAMFRDTLEREREMSSRLLQETTMTLDAWRSQFVTVQEENTRLRQLGTLALRQLQETERRAQEAEALLAEVSTAIGPRTFAALETYRRIRKGLHCRLVTLHTSLVTRPLGMLADARRRVRLLPSRLAGSETRAQVSAAAE